MVTVKGTIDAKEIVPYLREKLKRKVEVVEPKKEDGNNKEKDAGKEHKLKEGGEKVIKEGAPKVEVNKMEHHGYGHQTPMYWYDGFEPGQSSSNYPVEVQGGNLNQEGYNYNYMNQHQHGYDYNYMNQGQEGYMVDPHQHQQPPFYMHPHDPPPQMFSDENPNACSMM